MQITPLLQEKVLWWNIIFSLMGKQNMQAENVHFSTIFPMFRFPSGFGAVKERLTYW